MKAKWLFLAVLFLLVLIAAGVIRMRRAHSSAIAVGQEQTPAQVDDMAMQEQASPVKAEDVAVAESLPSASEPESSEVVPMDNIEMPLSESDKLASPELASRKPGEPLNPPPVPKQFPEPPVPQMGWAEARYEIDGRVVAPGNQHGQMSLVHVRPGARISATLKWPKALPGATVALEVVDGGRLEDGQLSHLVRVDEQGEIQLRYMANRQPGRCQVVARCGMDETVLCFWVADESAKNIPAGL